MITSLKLVEQDAISRFYTIISSATIKSYKFHYKKKTIRLVKRKSKKF